MPLKVSPLAPKSFARLPTIEGVRLATAQSGIRYRNRADLLLIIFDELADVAGVFTRSRCPSAPVDHCRQVLPHGKAKAVVVNSGNANAFTGHKGRASVDQVVQSAARAINAANDEIYVASTGIIGEPLDPIKITRLMDQLVETAAGDRWWEAAQAIMTTDTYAKLVSKEVMLDGVKVTINGIAKGAGMIAPDMATMLAFIVTDAAIDAAILQNVLAQTVDASFNAITVDSDTSTSDTVLVFATGGCRARGMPPILQKSDERLLAFEEALFAVLSELAVQIVSDGEGARHRIRVEVSGASTNIAAKKIAFAIANSPLVKAAVAGEDANWGRVVMAVGKSGEEADRDKLAIWFGKHRVAYQGERDQNYSEAQVAAVMKNAEIPIFVDLGLGKGRATVWGCDLTTDYVKINGDYRS